MARVVSFEGTKHRALQRNGIVRFGVWRSVRFHFEVT